MCTGLPIKAISKAGINVSFQLKNLVYRYTPTRAQAVCKQLKIWRLKIELLPFLMFAF
jgi:hypothetical protein